MEPVGRELGRSFDIIFPVAYAAVYALIALWVHVKFFPIGDVGVESDFYQGLVVAAQDLWKGNLSVASYPHKGPFYSFAIVFVHLFGGDWYRNAVVLNLLCAAGSILVLYRLLLRVFDRRLAVTATVSVSLAGEFFMHAHKASSDMLFFLLCFLAISALLIDSRHWLPLVGAGAFSAFAFLTRYNGAFLPVVAVFMVLFINPWRWARRRRLIAVAIYLVVFVLICAPWFALSWVETGNLLETDNLRNITQEFYGGPGNGDVPTEEFSSLGSMIAHDPAHFIKHYLLNIPRHLWLDVSSVVGFPTGVLMVLGLLLLLLVPPTRQQWAFYSFGVGYFLSMCMVFRLPRFAFPVMPMYAALGFSFIVGPHGERRSRLGEAVGDRVLMALRRITGRGMAGVRIAVVAGIFLLLIFEIVGLEKFYLERRPFFVFHAAQFLREHAGGAGRAAQQVVLARKPHMAYYSGMKYQAYPARVVDSREFITFAIEHDVDYLVYTPLERAYYHRGNRDWLTGVENTAGVERIFSDEGVKVYEFADWLDLDDEDGRQRLASRLVDLQELERLNDPGAVMRACSEISRLYSYNGKPGETAEFLIRGLEAARRLPDPAEADRQIRELRLEFLAVARTYFKQGRRDEGAALLEDALLELEDYWTQKERAFIHTALSEYYSAQDRSEDAARHLRALQDLRIPPDGQHRSDVTKSPIRDLDADE